MILRRFFTLTALALAVSLGLSDRANASYDTSVSTSSVNAPGGTIGGVPGTNAQGFGTGTSFTNTEFTTGSTTVPAPAGWFAFVDAGGSTIYLVNQLLTNQTGTIGVNESVYVAAAPGVSDSSSWTANLVISVTNPSTTGSTGNFGTGSVSETAAFTMSGTAYFPTSLAPPNLQFTSPTTIVLSNTAFTLFSPGAAGGNANNSNNNGAISANVSTASVPEPTSLVMLGSGLAGVIGLGLRRMRR
jgi:hypothetical protein